MKSKMQIKKYSYIFLCAMLTLTGCGGNEAEEGETEVLLDPVALPANTYTVSRQDIICADYMTGYVVPEVYTLSFEISGTVSYCEVHVGDSVEKYQELATLEEETLTHELEEIEEEYDQLEAYYDQINALWDEETASMEAELAAMNANTEEAERLQLSLDERELAHEEELEAQEVALDEITERYDEKNTDMTKNHLLSPCDGTIMDVTITTGDEVSADSCVIIVGDYSSSYIRCDTFYYESTIEKLEGMVGYVGDQTFELDFIPYTTEEIQAAASDFGINLPSRFSVATEGIEIEPGDMAGVELITDVAENVLCVTKDALYSDSDSYYVYKDVNGAKQRVDVEIGLDNGMEVEITDGDLEEGDLVYVKE